MKKRNKDMDKLKEIIKAGGSVMLNPTGFLFIVLMKKHKELFFIAPALIPIYFDWRCTGDRPFHC